MLAGALGVPWNLSWLWGHGSLVLNTRPVPPTARSFYRARQGQVPSVIVAARGQATEAVASSMCTCMAGTRLREIQNLR